MPTRCSSRILAGGEGLPDTQTFCSRRVESGWEDYKTESRANGLGDALRNSQDALWGIGQATNDCTRRRGREAAVGRGGSSGAGAQPPSSEPLSVCLRLIGDYGSQSVARILRRLGC